MLRFTHGLVAYLFDEAAALYQAKLADNRKPILETGANIIGDLPL